MSEMTRRELLQAAAAAVVTTGSGADVKASEKASESDERRELYTRSPIEIYTNTLSAAAGDELTLHVSTTARNFKIEIARVGLKETVVWVRDGLRGQFHATPDDAWANGCRWPASVRLKVPIEWGSGFYQIKAMTADERMPTAEFLAFVAVRATRPTAKILLVLSTATYGAYNNYGGACLYIRKDGDTTRGGLSGTTGEHKVSFRRPWMPGFLWKPETYNIDSEDRETNDPKNVDTADGRFTSKISGFTFHAVATGFHNWERVMVRWLEKNGYAVDYAVSSDLEFHPELLGRYRLMLSVGHDEYWSWGMRDTVETFIAQGGNVCFFSGNIACWQVRHEDDGHSMVCYKDNYSEDPYFKAGKKQHTATYWSSHHVARSETRLTGLSTWYAGMARFSGVTPQGAGGFLVYRPDHWVFKESGLSYGDSLGQASTIAHYEVDGCPIRIESGLPYPASFYDGPSTLEILALTPAALPRYISHATLAKGIFGEANLKAVEYVSQNRGHAVISIYTDGGTVFCAGTTDWTSGLTGRDPTVERVTKNLLDRLST